MPTLHTEDLIDSKLIDHHLVLLPEEVKDRVEGLRAFVEPPVDRQGADIRPQPSLALPSCLSSFDLD
jgi:hypothetical protein